MAGSLGGGASSLARALIGQFGAVMRLGLLGVLADAQIECVAEDEDDPPESALLHRLDAAAPDAVVVDWDDRRYEAVAASVLARRPDVTVVACSSERLFMRVVPGRQDRNVYESKLSAQGLVEAVMSASSDKGQQVYQGQ